MGKSSRKIPNKIPVKKNFLREIPVETPDDSPDEMFDIPKLTKTCLHFVMKQMFNNLLL